MFDILITDGQIIDGTGSNAFAADLGVRDGKIAALGFLDNAEAKIKLQANGCYVTPGLIDMHSHGDCTAPFYPGMEAYLGQGITTLFTGHCGLGLAPVDEWWLEMFAEERAISRVVAPLPCGNRIGFDRLVKTGALEPVIRDIFGTELDWRTWGEFTEHLNRKGMGVNMAGVVPHAQIRHQILGLDFKRPATESEIAGMIRLLERSLEEGAWGLGIGLDYSPGVYADANELNALAQTVAERGGVLTAHVRTRNSTGNLNKPQPPVNGIREFLDIGLHKGTKLHISHLMSGFTIAPYNPALAREAASQTLEVIHEYREKGVQVNWDVLPGKIFSCFNNIQLAGRLLPYVRFAGGKQAFSAALRRDSIYRQDLADELRGGRHVSVSSLVRIDPVENPDWDKTIFLTKTEEKDYIGLTLREIGESMGTDGVGAMLELLARDPEIYIGRKLPDETDCADYYYTQPEASIGLDNAGYPFGYSIDEGDMPIQKTPSDAYCGFIKLLCRRITPRFEDGIKKMTGNAAAALGLKDRGLIREGLAADLVVLSEDKLNPCEDLVNPGRPPAGIEWVIVNGRIVAERGKLLETTAGRVFDKRP